MLPTAEESWAQLCDNASLPPTNNMPMPRGSNSEHEVAETDQDDAFIVTDKKIQRLRVRQALQKASSLRQVDPVHNTTSKKSLPRRGLSRSKTCVQPHLNDDTVAPPDAAAEADCKSKRRSIPSRGSSRRELMRKAQEEKRNSMRGVPTKLKQFGKTLGTLNRSMENLVVETLNRSMENLYAQNENPEQVPPRKGEKGGNVVTEKQQQSELQCHSRNDEKKPERTKTAPSRTTSLGEKLNMLNTKGTNLSSGASIGSKIIKKISHSKLLTRQHSKNKYKSLKSKKGGRDSGGSDSDLLEDVAASAGQHVLSPDEEPNCATKRKSIRKAASTRELNNSATNKSGIDKYQRRRRSSKRQSLSRDDTKKGSLRRSMSKGSGTGPPSDSAEQSSSAKKLLMRRTKSSDDAEDHDPNTSSAPRKASIRKSKSHDLSTAEQPSLEAREGATSRRSMMSRAKSQSGGLRSRSKSRRSHSQSRRARSQSRTRRSRSKSRGRSQSRGPRRSRLIKAKSVSANLGGNSCGHDSNLNNNNNASNGNLVQSFAELNESLTLSILEVLKEKLNESTGLESTNSGVLTGYLDNSNLNGLRNAMADDAATVASDFTMDSTLAVKQGRGSSQKGQTLSSLGNLPRTIRTD